MTKNKYLLLTILLLFTAGIMPLAAAEGEYSDFVKSLLNNQFLLENFKLIGLAEKSLSDGQYDDSVKYAEEAIKYAQLSDDYVLQQMKIRDVNDAINAAQIVLDRARESGAPKNYTVIYNEAENSFNTAQEARSREEWDKSLEAANRVLTILSQIPDSPLFPAQYLVKNWIPMKDCLWNIAGKPQIYGDPFKWPIIYNANKSKLPKPDNPDLILPGMVLDIPSIKGESRAGILE